MLDHQTGDVYDIRQRPLSGVEVSRARGVRLITDNEEERYIGQKYCDHFPEQAIEALKVQRHA